jgi:hypothetical protein
LIARLLTLRFGPLGASEQSRILAASIAELDAMGERLLTSRTLDEALGIADSRFASIAEMTGRFSRRAHHTTATSRSRSATAQWSAAPLS